MQIDKQIQIDRQRYRPIDRQSDIDTVQIDRQSSVTRATAHATHILAGPGHINPAPAPLQLGLTMTKRREHKGRQSSLCL